MLLHLVRHGETALNANRTLQPPDTPLSERGFAQARAVAQRLAGLPLVGVFSSDLPRALQTAEAIAAACGGLAVQTSPLLHERNFGDWRGLPYDSLPFDPIANPQAPPGGESMDAFVARCSQAFDAALAEQRRLGGAIAVVSHGLVIRALLQTRLTVEADQVLPARIGNTSVTTVEASAPYRVRLVDCTAHLAGATAEDGRSLSGG